MPTEIARVIASAGSTCTVRVDRKEACSRCRVCSFPQNHAFLNVEIENPLGAQVGDYVELRMTGDRVLFAGFAVYLIPLFFGGAALVLATLFLAEILWQLLLCLAGVAVGYIITVVIDRKIRGTGSFSPVMTKIILSGGDRHGKDSSSDGGGV